MPAVWHTYGSFFFGILALETGLYKQIHRADRCDLSLFQLGLRLLNYLAVRGLPIPLPKLQMPNDLHCSKPVGRSNKLKYYPLIQSVM